MNIRTSLAAGAISVVALSLPLGAQGWESAAPGMRVSMRVVDSLQPGEVRRNAVVGTILRRDSTAFYLRVTAADTLRVAHGSISRLELSKGRSRVRSAIATALLGGTLVASFPPDRRSSLDFGQWFGAGAIVGGVIGAVVPDERWRRVKR
jgi:hypothetical protein